MSTFEVKIRKITVLPHPDADLLDIGMVDDYQVVVGKDQFKTGDLVAYIPEAAVVPDWLIERMGLVGRLAGSKHNRVKAVKLRGIVSQGLCVQMADCTNRKPERLPVDGPYIPGMRYAALRNETIANIVAEGMDVADFLGIYKWEPPIPAHMAGEVCNLFGHTISYDIENIKKFPTILVEGEPVEITEKIHGCVYPGTKIMLPNGEEVDISIIINDNKYTHVLSYDITTNQFVPKKITAKLRRPNFEGKRWINIYLENGRKLPITEDHPVFSEDRNMYIAAKDIIPGENIKSPI